MTLLPVSLTSTAYSHEPDSDVECYNVPTSPAQQLEEEVEVSPREFATPEKDLDQEVSEEKTRRLCPSLSLIRVPKTLKWNDVH